MKQIKTVLWEEIKDSVKSKKVIVIMGIVIMIMLTVYASGFLQVFYLWFFKVTQHQLPFMVSITYYLLFIIVPFLTTLLGHDRICGEIENNTIRGVISKIKRNSFVIGKFLAVLIIVFTMSAALILYSAIYSYVTTAQADWLYTFFVLLYLLLYIAACSAVTIFFSSSFMKSSTSLFILTFFYLFIQYINSGQTAFLSLFAYMSSIISFENVAAAVLIFTLYIFAFLSLSLLIFQKRDL